MLCLRSPVSEKKTQYHICYLSANESTNCFAVNLFPHIISVTTYCPFGFCCLLLNTLCYSQEYYHYPLLVLPLLRSDGQISAYQQCALLQICLIDHFPHNSTFKKQGLKYSEKERLLLSLQESNCSQRVSTAQTSRFIISYYYIQTDYGSLVNSLSEPIKHY